MPSYRHWTDYRYKVESGRSSTLKHHEIGTSGGTFLEFHTPFTFFCCQIGAEGTLKSLLSESADQFRLSFSNPGFITMKGPMAVSPWARLGLDLPWIRTMGRAFSALQGENAEALVQELYAKYRDLDWTHLHLWEKDSAIPGDRGFEPGKTPLVEELEAMLRAHLEANSDERSSRIGVMAEEGARVLDVVLLSPNRWWIGAHTVENFEHQWPGGVPQLPRSKEVVSRAYHKLNEAIAWSGIPMQTGEHVVEIGSSPGGACQLLLEKGLHVTGIDPAEMDPSILSHPRFTHWRAKSAQIKRRRFAAFDWLVCDANVAPNYTLDVVGDIVQYPTTRIRGMLLTLKISDWSQITNLPQQLARIESWGFETFVRQLAHNRSEVCVYAMR